MLVDLGRNDINRVCVPTSTNLDALMIVEKYSHVMHIVSHVSGKLRDECSPFDAFRSIFPAGTVSGAPKVKAMEWIATLEKVRLISTIIGSLVLTCPRVCRVCVVCF
jgi:anthranilate synthase component 1